MKVLNKKKEEEENINKDAIILPHLCHTILIAAWITWDPIDFA